jgi:hypothetical protein
VETKSDERNRRSRFLGTRTFGTSNLTTTDSHVSAHGRCAASAGESRRDGRATEGAVSKSKGGVRSGIGRPRRRSPRDRRAFALTRRGHLQTPPRRADPSRLSPPPQAKRERLEQMRKMGIGKFQKVRQARVASSVAIERRVRNLGRASWAPGPSSRSKSALLASDLSPSALFLDMTHASPSDASAITRRSSRERRTGRRADGCDETKRP